MSDPGMNSYGGSITFSPLVSSGANHIFDPAGGLHFDLPLATIQAFQNSALSFVAGNNQNNQGFLSGVFAHGSDLVSSSGERAANLNAGAISAGYALGRANIAVASKVADNAHDASIYAINQQTALAKYVSDNAVRSAMYSVQQQTTQVKAQQKGSTIRKLFGGLTGGIFG